MTNLKEKIAQEIGSYKTKCHLDEVMFQEDVWRLSDSILSLLSKELPEEKDGLFIPYHCSYCDGYNQCLKDIKTRWELPTEKGKKDG